MKKGERKIISRFFCGKKGRSSFYDGGGGGRLCKTKGEKKEGNPSLLLLHLKRKREDHRPLGLHGKKKKVDSGRRD